jgi:hypothetical protein
VKSVNRNYFDSIFPIIEEIYNHSNHQAKLWECTGRKRFLVNTWQKEVEQYWKTNQK